MTQRSKTPPLAGAPEAPAGANPERRMIAPRFVNDALACLIARGIAPGPVLAQAGLPEEVRAPVSAERYGALWQAAAQALGDEFFGLGARPMRPGSFTLLGHCVLHAPTLDVALRRALRFLTLVLDDPAGHLEVRGGSAIVVLKEDGAPRSAFAYRTYWIVLHGLACWLIGRRIPLQQVDFVCPPPPDDADYRTFFGAPVRFAQEESRLVFDAAYLRLVPARTERALKAFLRGAPANILVRYRHDAGLAAAVSARLHAVPPPLWPDVEALARQMRMPSSTLRRRLRGEGQSVQAIKDEIRRGRAMEALLGTDKGVGEIAAELGFTEPSAFHRAFRAWAGKSPGAFRRDGGAG